MERAGRQARSSLRKEPMTADTVAGFLSNGLMEWGVFRIYGYPDDGMNGITTALRRGGRWLSCVHTSGKRRACSSRCSWSRGRTLVTPLLIGRAIDDGIRPGRLNIVLLVVAALVGVALARGLFQLPRSSCSPQRRRCGRQLGEGRDGHHRLPGTTARAGGGRL